MSRPQCEQFERHNTTCEYLAPEPEFYAEITLLGEKLRALAENNHLPENEGQDIQTDRPHLKSLTMSETRRGLSMRKDRG